MSFGTVVAVSKSFSIFVHGRPKVMVKSTMGSNIDVEIGKCSRIDVEEEDGKHGDVKG